jgi:hypothetical protein
LPVELKRGQSDEQQYDLLFHDEQQYHLAAGSD